MNAEQIYDEIVQDIEFLSQYGKEPRYLILNEKTLTVLRKDKTTSTYFNEYDGVSYFVRLELVLTIDNTLEVGY